MILRCGLLLLLLFFDCVWTTKDSSDYGLNRNGITQIFSYWPSGHNDANMMGLRKREAEVPPVGQSEGGAIEDNNDPQKNIPVKSLTPPAVKAEVNAEVNVDLPKVSVNSTTMNSPNETAVNSTVVNGNDTKANATTAAKTTPNQLDLNSPGVLKRGLIVFGGFSLLAVAYFVFYRRKSSKNDSNSTHNTNDANQFRYGVLQSEDRRDNLELSRIPLTMESDDDDEDDVEIFDLGQKKKSLSYVNLQMNDEDIVLNMDNNEDKDDNLLLDIEDKTSETLINWSSNSSKSIL